MEKYFQHKVSAAIKDDDLDAFKELLLQKDIQDDLSSSNSGIVLKLLNKKSHDFIKQALPYMSIPSRSRLLESFAFSNRLDVVKLLVSRDAVTPHSDALFRAVCNDNIEMVKLLIPYSNVKRNNNAALLAGIELGYVEMVKTLLPHSNAKQSNSFPLQKAAHANKTHMIDILWEYSTPERAVKSLKDSKYDKTKPGIVYLFQKYESMKSKKEIRENIDKSNFKPKIRQRKI